MIKLGNVFSRENITFFIAISGFVLSIINAIKNGIFNFPKIRLTYRSHYYGRTMNFDLLIENDSHKEIALTRMFLLVNGKKFEFRWYPKNIWTFVNTTKGIITKEVIKSVSFPTVLGGLGAIGGYFAVDVDSGTADLLREKCRIEILINTNRKTFKFSTSADNYKIHDIQ